MPNFDSPFALILILKEAISWNLLLLHLDDENERKQGHVNAVQPNGGRDFFCNRVVLQFPSKLDIEGL